MLLVIGKSVIDCFTAVCTFAIFKKYIVTEMDRINNNGIEQWKMRNVVAELKKKLKLFSNLKISQGNKK